MKRLAAWAIAILLSLSGCTVTYTTQVTEPTLPESPVYESDDYSDLLAQIQRMNANLYQQNQRFYAFKGAPAMPGATIAMADSAMAESADQVAGSAAANTAPYSETNIQVEGVDEADIIKTDGRFLYVVANNRLNIIDAANPATMKVAATISFQSQLELANGIRSENVLEMYLDETLKRLTLIINGYDQAQYGQNYTLTTVYSIEDPYNPIEIRRFAQEGTYISSRRIGEHVYVVSQKYQIRIYADAVQPEAVPKAAIVDDRVMTASELTAPAESQSSTTPDPAGLGTQQNPTETSPSLEIFPKISETGTTNFKIVKPRQIALIESGDPYQQVVLASLDTKDTAKPAKVLAVLGSSGTVYASAKYLYLFGYQMTWNKDGTWADAGTEIYRYELAAGDIAKAGQGTVPGTVLNQFSLDEYNGYLRVATTTMPNWVDSQAMKNNLYVLDPNLKITGSVTGLAKNETIRSVRFMGDRGYIVTFRTTDPLFVLDLANPASPRVVGELKIPGYSSYLHLWQKDRLLGFGYDAAVENDRAFEKGLKVSLFDIADPANPKEISTLLLGSRGSYSELNNNHKVLLADPKVNILAYPVLLAKTSSSSPLEYGMPYFQGLAVMSIINDRIQLVGGISHIDRKRGLNDPSEPLTGDEMNRFYGYDQVLRGAYIGNVLYTFSNHEIMASSMNDLSSIGSVELPGYEEQTAWWGGGVFEGGMPAVKTAPAIDALPE